MVRIFAALFAAGIAWGTAHCSTVREQWLTAHAMEIASKARSQCQRIEAPSKQRDCMQRVVSASASTPAATALGRQIAGPHQEETQRQLRERAISFALSYKGAA